MTIQTISRYPAIQKAALAIAYDNGMVNRGTTEAEFLHRVDKVLQHEPQLKAVESVLASFTEEQLDTLCTGEEQEQLALLAGNPLSGHIRGLLTYIFEC